MIEQLFRLSDYFQYLIKARGRHGIHSPFVYQFIENVLLAKNEVATFHAVEHVRQSMLKSKSILEYEDLGPGNNSGKRSLNKLVARTARQAKYGRLLYYLIKNNNYKNVLELGTGTGITALYQAIALDENANFVSIEGSKSLSEIARYNAQKVGIECNAHFVTGNFDMVLKDILIQLQSVDMAYIDGNHRKEPTINYFETILPYLHSNSCLVFDDINWTEEMQQAWSYIKNHDSVRLSIDLFNFGLVFFRTENIEKEHFVLRY